MFKEIREDMKQFLKQKLYIWPVILTAVLSYGFLMGNPTIGIDDTAVERYFRDGLAPYVGRWFLFLLNKLFHIAEFAPFLTEFLAVVFMIISVTLWCIAFWRILGDKIPLSGYTFFSCIFLSAPILSEIFTYYLHNGIGIAYGLTAIGAIFFVESMKKDVKKRWHCFALSVFFVIMAAGCYESLVMVYILGIVMMYLLLCKEEAGEKYHRGLIGWILWGGMSIAVLFLARSLIIGTIKAVFRLEEKILVLPTRGLSGVLEWLDETNARGELTMLFKRFFLKYYINGLEYFPITIFVFAAGFLVLYCIIQTIRYRRPIILICGAAILLIPWIMPIIEMQATPYRASQYIPLVCAFAVLLLADLIHEMAAGTWRKFLWYATAFFLTVWTYNQCTEMNKWFYVDYLKYEDAKNTVNTIAYELEKSYDIGKSVIFVGEYQLPNSVLSNAGLKIGSEEFQRIRKISDMLDVHLKEKYYNANGYYQMAEIPYLSVINWGTDAFDGTNIELFNFMEMHGHSLKMETDKARYEEAAALAQEWNMPSWPREGYIQETENYIIVKLGDIRQ